MANYNSLKATINANVKTNNNQEITGSVMNSVLNAMVNTLGAGYQYAGVATPSTNPGTPDAKVFYLAATAGTYNNFGGLVLADGEVAVLKWDSSWHKEMTGIASADKLNQLSQKVNDIDYTSAMLTGQSINVGSYSVGDVVNTTPQDNPSISCILLSVSKNAIIKITGQGASGPRLWAILDADKKLIAKADAAITETDLKLTIAQDGYVIVNVYTANTHSVISLTPFATSAELLQLSTFVNDTFNAYAKDGSFFDSEYKNCISKTTGEIRNDGASNVKCTTKFLPIKPGLKIFGCTGTIQTLIAFYDAGLNFISAHTTATQGVNVLVTIQAADIPSNAKYFRSSGFDGAYVEGLTNDDLLIASLEIARVLVSDIGFNPLTINNIKDKTIATNVSEGSVVSLSYVANPNYACSVTAVKAGDIVHFCGVGSNSYRLVALTDKTLHLLYKTPNNTFWAESVKVVQDGYVIINYTTTHDFLFYVECAEKYILPFGRSKWIAMGDSITQGYYSTSEGSAVDAQRCWAHIVAAINRYTLSNVGVGGQGYKHIQNGANATDLVQTLDFSGYDLVTLAYGINDYKGGDTLGTMDDVVADKGSVIACLRYVIETIISSNPTIKIILVTPLNARGYEGARLGDETTDYAIGHQVNGKTLEDFYNAFVEVCKYYGIQYIDMTFASVVGRKNMVTTLPDGVHPSLDAHMQLGRELARKITQY